MDLDFTEKDEAFREEVREFLNEKLPKRLSDKVRYGQRLTKADMEEWHAILNERGWLAPHWPVEWGGTDWSVVQRFIFGSFAGHECGRRNVVTHCLLRRLFSDWYGMRLRAR